VRIWDIPPERLCRAHLLGEHRELHAIWAVLTTGKAGYRHHPETLRWEGRLAALYARHAELVSEMLARGYRHASPLDARLATGAAVQDRYLDPPEQQIAILRSKACACDV
jgi:Pyrimidine dimer DNA glycosylase